MQLFNEKSKIIILIFSVIFLTISIYYFSVHISEIGLRPNSNISSNKMTSVEEFILNVNKPTKVLLLHNAKIGSGYVSFKLVGDDSQVIEEYKLTEDEFINKVYNLEEGCYLCTIKRDVSKNKESFKFYYDKRHIEQEYLKSDSKTSN